MKVARTVEIASVVDPNTSPSSRVQRLSRISPDAPDRKKQASNTARIGERTLYDRGPAPGYSWSQRTVQPTTSAAGRMDPHESRACEAKIFASHPKGGEAGEPKARRVRGPAVKTDPSPFPSPRC